MSERRSNVFQGFLDTASEWNRMRQLGSYGYEPGYEERERTVANAWVPNADIFARGQDLVVRLELGGVAREDVDITFYENVLTVSGERTDDLGDDDVVFYVHERYYGAFRRSMTLPPGVSEDKIEAQFDNGMLEITIRDAAAVEPRRIEIGEKPG